MFISPGTANEVTVISVLVDALCNLFIAPVIGEYAITIGVVLFLVVKKFINPCPLVAENVGIKLRHPGIETDPGASS